MMVNYRPEYRHEWSAKSYYAQLRLDPLGGESAESLLDALIGNDAGLADLKRLVIERTEGNPFFMEETVQSMFENGVLVRNGKVSLAQPLSSIKIPPSVQRHPGRAHRSAYRSRKKICCRRFRSSARNFRSGWSSGWSTRAKTSSRR